MKKLAVLLCALSTPLIAQSIVFPSPTFGTIPPLRERFDTTATGAYISNPTFTGFGVYARIGGINACMVATNALLPPLSPPHSMFGRGCDVQWRINGQMRRFGGYFRRAPAGIVVPTATFRFYDVANIPIGSMTVPLTNVWTWRGFITFPMWSRVEVIGGGSQPGYVAHDDIRIRWF